MMEDMCSMEEKKDEKISISDIHQSDSFVVELNGFAHHLMEKDINGSNNSRITLQRNVSRKGSVGNGELKISGNDRDAVTTSTSPTAGGSTPEKPSPVAMGPAEQSHHQITINSGGPTAGGAVAESINSVGRRFSFRRTRMRIISDPKQILVFFATLSSIGTILLIYFTLSMTKLNSDGTASI